MKKKMKKCHRCEEPKRVVHFHRRAEAPDGLARYCKACIVIQKKEKAKAEREAGERHRAEFGRPAPPTF